MKTTTQPPRNSIDCSPMRRGFILVALPLAWFALSLTPKSFGVSPTPDGGYPNDNTAEGTNALLNLTTGTDNTAIGFNALSNTATGGFNTATGSGALQSNTTGFFNTATGSGVLQSNTTGFENTANGDSALFSNRSGSYNTATGATALHNNTTGFVNTATGHGALYFNTTGGGNTATGVDALGFNYTGKRNTATGFAALWESLGDCAGPGGNDNTATGAGALSSSLTGSNNTATGSGALENNYEGSNNTAEGFQALKNSGGSNNIALGSSAGIYLTTGNNNIDIGALGYAGDSDTIRIGRLGVQKAAYMQGISGTTVGSGATVIVGSNGRLGTVQSSARFKDEIQPMDKVSEAILELKPVTFRYKKELDPESIPQFGLVAEQVEKVNPDLVARDADGKVYTVRYDAVNAMLLNEFLKQHRQVQEQQKQIAKLTAQLKEQAAQIRKVNDKVEMSRRAPQVVGNNQ